MSTTPPALTHPFRGVPVSQGWRDGSHAKPGGGPAIDYPLAYGAPLPAPFGGRVTRGEGGAAGRTVTITHRTGWQIVFCHLSQFAAVTDARQGQVIGYAGNTGSVRPAPTRRNPRAGTHLHTYGLTPWGERWDWTATAQAQHLASLAAAVASLTPDPDPFEEETEEMDIISTDPQAVKYELRAGKRREITKAEMKAIRKLEAAGKPVHYAEMDAATIAALPLA